MRLRSTLIAAAAILTLAAAAPAPVPVARITPDYPETAEPAGVAGRVKVQLTVADTGFVTAASLLSEEPEGFGFGNAALAAGRRWTFEPGKPGSFTITMRFAPSDGREAIDLADLPEAEPVSRVSPHYPVAALENEVPGDATIAVSLAEDGSVAESWLALEAPTGYGFGEAAKAAVSRWRFKPGGAGLYVVSVRFRIPGQPDGVHWADLKRLPEPVHRVPIAYPQAALPTSEDGEVRLAVTLAEDGSVIEAAVVTERPKELGFGVAAREAVLLWRFEKNLAGTYRAKLAVKPPATGAAN